MEDKQKLDIESIHLDDPSDTGSTPPVSPSSKDRRKKKKKNRNNNHNKKNCYNNPDLDDGRRRKSSPADDDDEDNDDEQNQSAFAQRSEPRPIPLRASKAYEYEDAHALDSSPSSPYPLSTSCPLFSLRSALRGGHEGLGLGPRPKLHVKWAVDVHDPPKTSASHTSNRVARGSSSRKKRSKSKTKAKNTRPQQGSSIGNQEVVPCAADSPFSEDEALPEKPGAADCNGVSAGSFDVSVDKLYSLSPCKSFFASMEVAMQHMIMASKFIEQENIAGALIEYKAAANVFRLAKLDAEAESQNDRRVAAIRGQVLAYIAMATLYSASGQGSKGQKCHRMALEACRQVQQQQQSVECSSSTSTSTSIENFHQFKGNGGSNHCSLAAVLKASPSKTGCEASSVCI